MSKPFFLASFLPGDGAENSAPSRRGKVRR
jgi:hypothetical protein